jgi:hypothetical protein
MKVYRSKIGPELVIPISLIFISLGVFMAYQRTWLGFAFILTIAAFLAHMLLTTYYTIIGNTLKIKCGFFYNDSIDIAAIKKISESKVALKSPAASFDRLEIIYNTFDSVLISPKEKAAFVQDLLSVKPSIEVTFKV